MNDRIWWQIQCVKAWRRTYAFTTCALIIVAVVVIWSIA